MASRRSTEAGRVRARELKRCRQRKCSCEVCGYTVRVTRAWLLEGVPICPHHGPMMPELPADLAFIGAIGPDDMPAPMWTQICYANGWEQSIQRKGAAAVAFERAQLEGGGPLAHHPGADHCAYPGCGLWVTTGAERCAAGHAQHDGAAELEPMPF